MALVLPSKPTSETRWGPTLNEYLDYPQANLDFVQYPDEAAICIAIDDLLYNPDAVTFNTLEIIMSLIHRPRMLTLLVHENAVGGCMGLLEEYAARNGPNSSLFEHAFGFLGLHVLALVLQVGLLDGFGNYLKSLPPVWTGGPECTWDLKAPAIENGFIPRLYIAIAGETLHPSCLKPTLSDYRIKWFQDSYGDDRACLPAIGGFMYRDAVFVLQQLFDHRNMFLECCFRTRAPGWSILIYMIQCMLDDRSYEGRRVPQLWQKHRDIVFRYSLVSGLREESFIEALCGRYAEQHASTFLEVSMAIDFQDAQTIQLAFIRKYRPNAKGTHTRDLTYETNVTFYVRDNLANYLPLQFAFDETTLEIVWDALLCVGRDSRWQDVDMYMGGSYGGIYQMLERDDVELTLKVILTLYKFDVVSMFGRYLLLPSYLQNNLPNVVDAGKYFLRALSSCTDDDSVPPAPFTDPNIRQDGIMAVTQIGKVVGRRLRRSETPLLLDDYYPDWYKTLLFLQREKSMHNRRSHFYHLSAESEAAWMVFGEGLGFTKYLNPKSNATRQGQRCMYPRCADPEAARFETKSGERYCSVRCQVACKRGSKA